MKRVFLCIVLWVPCVSSWAILPRLFPYPPSFVLFSPRTRRRSRTTTTRTTVGVPVPGASLLFFGGDDAVSTGLPENVDLSYYYDDDDDDMESSGTATSSREEASSGTSPSWETDLQPQAESEVEDLGDFLMDDEDYEDSYNKDDNDDVENSDIELADDASSLSPELYEEEEEEDGGRWSREYARWIQAAERTLQNLSKKQRSLQTELQKAQSLEDTVRRANLITSHMYLFHQDQTIRSVTVTDWESGEEIEITLDPAYESASQEANALFQQARKLKRGSLKVAELLDETSSAIQTLTEILQDFAAVIQENNNINTIAESAVRLLQDKLLQTSRITHFEAPPPPSAESSPKPPSGRGGSSSGSGINSKFKAASASSPSLGSPASNVRKIISPAGTIILVGRNRRGNEYLSMVVANRKGSKTMSDLWLHARGTPGAHVLIPQRRGSKPATEECVQLAANIAVFYSDARSEKRAQVTVASPKHILKPRNAPLGAVQLRQEDRVMVGIPSQVPPELQQAREESSSPSSSGGAVSTTTTTSGSSSEYRAADKAKHRKKTLAAAAAAASKAKRNNNSKRGKKQ